MVEIAKDFHIIGHRGAAGERFENSLDGFKHSLTLNIGAVELDIREHQGQLWVIHDHELERLTGKVGLFEEQADVAAIRLLNGEAVPLLQQVLDLYWGKMPLNIEIKSLQNKRLLLDLLAKYPQLPASSGMPWVLISSFNHRQILDLRQLGCPWPLAPISYGVPVLVDQMIELIEPWSWHFDDEYLDFDLIAYLHTRGLRSMVFTVNSEARARFLHNNGVAGVFTDFPSKLK